MKYLPSAKSPLWQILFAAQFFAFAYLIINGDFTFENGAYSVGITIPLSLLILAAIFFITLALSLLAVRNYNKTHPKANLSIFQIAPAEINDDDERLSSLTSKATRNVYLYHNLTLPILPVVILFTQPSLPTIVILLGALTIGHYIAYWIGIKPALQS